MATTLARKYRADVTADLTLASGWLPVNGIDDLNDTVTPNLEETSAYDTTGWSTREVTMQDWSLVLSIFRRIVAGVYDPGQELVRLTRGQFGTNARVGVRWYDRNGGPEAYQGIAIPAWTRANTGVSNVEKASITFNATDIPLVTLATNPIVANPNAVPSILSVTPTGAAAGSQVQIVGAGFAGLSAGTAVKFGGVNASSYIVVSDNVIVAIMPAGSAGSAAVTVTNAAGASTAFPYTRG